MAKEPPQKGNPDSWEGIEKTDAPQFVPGNPAQIEAFAKKIGATATDLRENVQVPLSKITTDAGKGNQDPWTGDAAKLFMDKVHSVAVPQVKTAADTHVGLHNVLMDWAQAVRNWQTHVELALQIGVDAYQRYKKLPKGGLQKRTTPPESLVELNRMAESIGQWMTSYKDQAERLATYIQRAASGEPIDMRQERQNQKWEEYQELMEKKYPDAAKK